MSDKPVPGALIRTAIRHKLPRGLSHPVGVEIISRILSGCPRYHDLWTAFGSKPLLMHAAAGEGADFRLAFAVVCNNYSNTWYLSVPAVPSNERATARQILLAVGLPAVHNWLCRARPETWHEGFRVLEVGYKGEPLRVCVVESLNHRVVSSSIIVVDKVEGN
jgi:hypothetical protein